MKQELVQRHKHGPPREDPEDEPLPEFPENAASKAAERWLLKHPEL